MTNRLYLTLLLLALTLPTQAADLDLAASKITVHISKSGMFAAFAHNHIISAPLASGHLDAEKRTIVLKFRAQEMKVLDPDASDNERSTIESNMKGPEVLEPGRFPEITFASTSVQTPAAEAAGTPSGTHYLVRGDLTLHGITRSVDVSVTVSGSHYTGKVTLKQTDFGIAPIKIGGGAIRVKDAIEIDFEIVTK